MLGWRMLWGSNPKNGSPRIGRSIFGLLRAKTMRSSRLSNRHSKTFFLVLVRPCCFHIVCQAYLGCLVYHANSSEVPPAKRTFVMSMADAYRLGRELIDQEPNRSVQIRRRVDTRIPSPLLSATAPAPVGKPAFGGLGNLRASKPVSNWAAKTTSSNQTGSAAAIAASAVPSRAPTPIAPILTQLPPLHAESETGRFGESATVGQVGTVDADDWDVDGV